MNFTYKNTNIYYTCEGKGTAIVLLHGFLENSTMWQYFVAGLSKKHRVICIDLLGHGKTDCLGYIHTMENQATMVKAVLNHLRLRKYVLVGHSMGGYVALTFAQQFSKNVKGLCLINSTALPDTTAKKEHRNRAIKAVKKHKNTFIKVAIPMLFAKENRKKFATEITHITQEAMQISTQSVVATLEGLKLRHNHTPFYKKAHFPIQIMAGKQDSIVPIENVYAETQNTKAQVIEFPDGHMSTVENKNETLAALVGFVKTCK